MQEYVTIDQNTTADQVMTAIAALEKAQQQEVMNAAMRYSRTLALYFGVLFAPNFAAAIVADAVYKNKIAKDVQSMREFSKNAQTFRMLALRRGGVSVLGLIASYMLVNLVLKLVNLVLNAIIIYQ